MEKTNKFVDTGDRFFSPPPHKTRLQAFRTFLYNPETHSCLGRTFCSWVKILTFYVIFYSCLAGFFAVCMWGLLQSIDKENPTYKLDSSLIGSSPGLASRPLPPEGRESVLEYHEGDQTWSNSEWPELFGDFIKEYQQPSEANICSHTTGTVPCSVNIDDWKACKPNGTKITSCLFLKLNKVIDWKPEYYKDETHLPSEMPQQLKEAFGNASQEERQKVWISCEGRHENDMNNLGKVKYYPKQGFPGYYFPFLRQKEFRSPVVAVHFISPAKETEINIECRAWAPNIHQDRKEQLGVLNYKIKFY